MLDLTAREWAAILPLVVLMVWMGVASPTFLPPSARPTRASWSAPSKASSSRCRTPLPRLPQEAANAR